MLIKTQIKKITINLLWATIAGLTLTACESSNVSKETGSHRPVEYIALPDQSISPGTPSSGISGDLVNQRLAFSQTIYPLLRANCGGCHGDDSTTAFAQTDVSAAFDIVNANFLDKNSPQDSLLVKRLGINEHNCWSDCTSNANQMESAIIRFLSSTVTPATENNNSPQPILTTPVEPVTPGDNITSNNRPTATNNFYEAQFNTPLTTGNVLNNDLDVDGDTLSISEADSTSIQGGNVRNNLDGTFIYTPPVNYSGTDSFIYSISDGKGGTDSAVVRIVIQKNNTPTVIPPTPTPGPLNDIDAFSTTVYPLATQYCASCHGGTLPFAAFADTNLQSAYDITLQRGLVDLQNPANSSLVSFLSVRSHNCWSDCATNASAFESAITQWQELTNGPVAEIPNNNPVAENDSFVAQTNIPLTTGNVLDNDSDANGDTLTVSAVDAVSTWGGTIQNNLDGTFTYTSAIDYAGNDAFNYTISDGLGGFANAVVAIVVKNDNEPTITPTPNSVEAFTQSLHPLLTQYCVSCHGGTSVVTAFAQTNAQLAHDITIQNGLVDLLNPNSSNLVARLAVTEHNCWSDCATNASVLEGAIAEWQQLINEGTVGTPSNPPNNQNPVATDDNYDTRSNISFTTESVFTNDFDADGDTLSISNFNSNSSQGGSIVNNLNGTFTYTPAFNFVGIDIFSYTISDGQGGSDSAIVTINVLANNTAVAIDDLIKINQDVSTVITVLLVNDIVPAGKTLSIISVDSVTLSGGRAILNTDNTITYTPPTGFSGQDSFSYSISDGSAISSAQVQIDINSQPLAIDDVVFTFIDVTATSDNVLLNDLDKNGDTLTITSFDTASAQAGNVAYNGNGTFTYSPPNNFQGGDSFNYIVSDGRGGSASATVSIAVTLPGLQDSNRYLQFPNQSSPLFAENEASATAYYAAIDPGNQRATLEAWRNVNGFNIGADALATYINNNDLGFARRMFIRTDPTTGLISSYVENYANLDDALNEVNVIATVAMEYTVAPGQDPLDPEAKRYTTFYVFDGNDDRALGADLDGRGFKFAPGLCNTCHGGRPKALVNGAYPDAGETGAGFIPWDLDTYLFTDNTATVSRAAQENQFKVLNQTVLNTNPKTAAREAIEGWYGGPGLPSNTFNGGFIPAGWLPPAAPANATQLYLQVAAPYCRACHVMLGSEQQNDIDFASYDKFISYTPAIERLVFDEGIMPMALRTYDRFWENINIPETLATFLNSSRVLANQDLLTPGRAIANPGPFREAALGKINLNGNGSLFAGATTTTTTTTPRTCTRRGCTPGTTTTTTTTDSVFEWTLTSVPAGSNAVLIDANQANASFVADVPGDYIAQLVVGANPSSPPAEVVIRVDPTARPISFVGDVAPVFNACAACHLGFDNPRFNNTAILYSNVINYVNTDDPINSSILTKPSGQHHGGGTIPGFETTVSEDYQTILNWILEGAADN